MNRVFPELLKHFHAIEIDYADGRGIDFEPFDGFLTEHDTAGWIRAWTGITELDGHEFLVFGQDGTGGYAAFWCVRQTDDVLQQPVVFFGSEGESAVIAQSFYDYAWLFAGGAGPMEATTLRGCERRPDQNFLAFAEQHAPSHRKLVAEVLANASAEFPGFAERFEN